MESVYILLFVLKYPLVYLSAFYEIIDILDKGVIGEEEVVIYGFFHQNIYKYNFKINDIYTTLSSTSKRAIL